MMIDDFKIRMYTKKELSTHSRQPSDGMDPSLHPAME